MMTGIPVQLPLPSDAVLRRRLKGERERCDEKKARSHPHARAADGASSSFPTKYRAQARAHSWQRPSEGLPQMTSAMRRKGVEAKNKNMVREVLWV